VPPPTEQECQGCAGRPRDGQCEMSSVMAGSYDLGRSGDQESYCHAQDRSEEQEPDSEDRLGVSLAAHDGSVRSLPEGMSVTRSGTSSATVRTLT
jgi:hypothetical protein